MEKSRAIELLKLAVPLKALTQQEYADFVEAVNMGMDALEEQLSKEGATSDMISRQAAIDAVEKNACNTQRIIDAVNNLPSVQPEPKEGEWVQIQRCARDAQPDLECPFCKHRIGWWDMGRYCAGCGAKLKGGAG